MLKFFRKYNKWILGVGGSLLMIVFLIQPVMQMFTADQMKVALGEYEGGEVTRGDVRDAQSDLRVLERFGLLLDPDGGNDSQDRVRWALILKDAQRLGLSASLTEVVDLKRSFGASDADIEMIASQMEATTGYIHHAMRNWLIVQRYKELLAAQAHLPGRQRAEKMRAYINNMRQNNYSDAMLNQAEAYGTSRLSKPIIEHFLQDLGAAVTGRAVMIEAERILEDTPKPSDEQVLALFDKYKEDLPGTGEPYGFGYRVPDRVKIEYLSISMDDARQYVKVTEADAIAHYRSYPDRYSGEGEAAGPKPFESVRDDVIEDLTGKLAFEMVDKMAKAAYGSLYEDTRGMPKEDDYRVLGDTALRPLREVAEALQAEFGLQPDVRSAGGGTWVNADELSSLPGIGLSGLADNRNVSFASFILSTRELNPETDNPLLPRRLQVGLAGAPLMDYNGSRYVFRLTDAQPTRVPESQEEVREQVGQDAWMLAAYERLLADSDSLLARAVEVGLETVATDEETNIVPLPLTRRRVRLPNGMLGVPYLQSIGQSDAFIEAFFSTANDAREAGDLVDVSAEAVTGIVGVDAELALVVYRVDEYEPITQEVYQQSSSDPILPVFIDTTVLAEARYENPLSYKALAHRMNYIDRAGPADDEEGAGGDVAQESGEPEQADASESGDAS